MEVPGIYWHFVDVDVDRRVLHRLHHLSRCCNPLRSEREAFRVLLYVLAVFLVGDRSSCSSIQAL